MTMQDGQCLMIKTKDSRRFFTHEKNYVQLLEFSKTFKAEISVVAVKEAEVLDLAELAPAICNANYVQNIPAEVRILEVKMPKKSRNRQRILQNAKEISAHIEEKFLAGTIVSLRDLTVTFNKVTSACLCNHVALIRRKLELEGKQFVKVGGGKYRLTDTQEKV